jgi:hypothetical protein
MKLAGMERQFNAVYAVEYSAGSVFETNVSAFTFTSEACIAYYGPRL